LSDHEEYDHVGAEETSEVGGSSVYEDAVGEENDATEQLSISPCLG
jgi:hypothetical protein